LIDSPWEKHSGISIDFSDKSPYRFGLEFQNGQFNGLVTGVVRKAKEQALHPAEHETLVRSFGPGTENESWLWFRYASSRDSLLPVQINWRDANEPWIDIANGSLATRIAEAFAKTHQVLKECGVG
jgi:hypothetical protein